MRTHGAITILILAAACQEATAPPPAPPPPPPSPRLAFTAEPTISVAGATLAPVAIELLGQDGRRMTGASQAVQLTLGVNPTGGSLSGTTTVQATDGVATFRDLSLDLHGDGYTLAASATGFDAAVSDPFRVLPPLPSFAPLTIDPMLTVSGNMSVGPDGRVHVSYQDYDRRDLRYATCAATCGDAGSWEAATLWRSSIVGTASALGIDVQGAVHLAFLGINNGKDLGYAVCTANCSLLASWDTVTVDDKQYAGRELDLALDDAGGVHLSYKATIDTVGDLLHYAWCPSNCTERAAWRTTLVDADARVARPTSIAVARDGRVHIAYYDIHGADLGYATCPADCDVPTQWSRGRIATDGDVGRSKAVAVDASGRVHVAYTHWDRGQVFYATCGSGCAAAGAWTSVAVDEPATDVSLAVDDSGVVHLVRYAIIANEGNLRYARCHAECTTEAGWSFSVVENAHTANAVGPVIALDPEGRPRIAYHDIRQGRLRYAQ